MVRSLLVFIVVALLAGCTEDTTSSDDDGPAPAQDARIGAPTWAIGDWWTYRVGGDVVTWVVTEDLGDAWMVDLDNADWAFGHAAFQQISTVGEISKQHLDGSQEAGAVHFFDFPLEQNKTWDLQWDGTTWEATVVDLTDGTAEVQATNMDGELRVYIYDNATKWFRTIAAYDMNGTEQFSAELDRSGESYSGTYARWTLHGHHAMGYGPGDVSLDTFDVPEDADGIWYQVAITCDPGGVEGDQGTASLEVHPQGDTNVGLSYNQVCPNELEDSAVLEPQPGEWGITASSTGGTIEATFIPRTLVEQSL